MKSETLVENKSVLVTGATGTVGAALSQRLIKLGVGQLRVLDNDEASLFFFEQQHAENPVECILGDVRDCDGIARACKGMDMVFHAAALKHVPLCERNPLEAIKTNILGVQNVVEGAIQNACERVLYMSSDKAVNPTSVMGTSKLMGEQLISAANLQTRETICTTTRFGNVLDSRGSVVPLFRKQISAGGPVTLTDASMTRFVMTQREAVDLVLDAMALARGGETFITKMTVIRIEDLAHVMIEELAPKFGYDPDKIDIQFVGPRSGEKMYEELMNSEETRRSLELEDLYAVLPAIRDLYDRFDYDFPDTVSTEVKLPYQSRSESAISKESLKSYLEEAGIFSSELT
jgi:FlaA1/EpsC-like NDP-sugar epimerase